MGTGQRLGCRRCNEQLYDLGDCGYHDSTLCFECEEDEFFSNRRAAEVAKVAREWLNRLESKGGHYYDGIPGELMDAVEKWEK